MFAWNYLSSCACVHASTQQRLTLAAPGRPQTGWSRFLLAPWRGGNESRCLFAIHICYGSRCHLILVQFNDLFRTINHLLFDACSRGRIIHHYLSLTAWHACSRAPSATAGASRPRINYHVSHLPVCAGPSSSSMIRRTF